MADDTLLDEIRLMAKADHAYRLPREANPYGAQDPRADAWLAGWQEEDDRVHALDEEVAKLPQFRIAVAIMSGETVLHRIDRSDFAHYKVSNLRATNVRAVSYESAEARMAYPGRDDVHIRVTHEGQGGMFD